MQALSILDNYTLGKLECTTLIIKNTVYYALQVSCPLWKRQMSSVALEGLYLFLHESNQSCALL